MRLSLDLQPDGASTPESGELSERLDVKVSLAFTSDRRARGA
jgi:hypothetical protein